MSKRGRGFRPHMRTDGSVAQVNGGGSSFPVQRVIERSRIDGDQLGEVYLALCDHTPDERRPIIYVHLHTVTLRHHDPHKPVAFSEPQLRRFIDELQRIQAKMLGLRTPKDQQPPAEREPMRRMRGRRPVSREAPSPSEANGAEA